MTDDKIDQVDNIIAEKINQIMDKHPGLTETRDTAIAAAQATEDTIESNKEELPTWGSYDENNAPEEVVTAEDVVQDPLTAEIIKDDAGNIVKNRFGPTDAAVDVVDKIDELEKHVVELMNAVVALTKSHDSLCANIQATVMERMNKTKRGKTKVTLYTEAEDALYTKYLEHFKSKTGKTQRDLTNGVNQLIMSSHDYTVGKPSGCAATEHILSKVAKDYATDNEKYLSINSYLDCVKDYVTFITKEEIVI